MKYDKDHYRAIKYKDWRWIAWEDKLALHCFSRQLLDGKWVELRCRESELEDGSFRLMCNNGWTR